MKWADLTTGAKAILEWVEHVWTGQRQTLTISLGKTWVQPLKYVGSVEVDVTSELFEEISAWLPYSDSTVRKPS